MVVCRYEAIVVSVLLGCTADSSSVRVVDESCEPRALAVDATTLYWTHATCDGGSVQTASIGGGPATPLVASAPNALSIAVDANYVYWTQYDRYDGAVLRVAKEGGVPQTLASGHAGPSGLLVDDTYVYWQDELEAGGLFEVPKDGSGPARPIASGYLTLAAVDAAYVYWVDGDSVYRQSKSTHDSDVLLTVGSSPVTHIKSVVATGSETFIWAATDRPDPLETWLYAGGARVATYTGEVTSYSFADSTHLYFVEDGLKRKLLDGSAIETVTTFPSGGSVWAVADGQSYVYWIGDDGIYSVKK